MIEVERKFILSDLPSGINYERVHNVKHYYTQDGVRYSMAIEKGKDNKYCKCVKTPTDIPYANNEDETQLTFDEFLHILNGLDKTKTGFVDKTRYTTHDEFGHKWEIDVFHSISLVMAECEILVESIDLHYKVNEIVVPKFIATVLLFEVEDYNKYNNKNLTRPLCV